MAFGYKNIGEAKAVGTTPTAVGNGALGEKILAKLHLANVSTGTINVKAWVVPPDWSAGEPIGTSLVYTITGGTGLSLSPGGGAAQLDCFLSSDQQVVVASSTTGSLDAKVWGSAES